MGGVTREDVTLTDGPTGGKCTPRTAATEGPVSGSVLVIGGGIGGMETALNLVGAGFRVYLCDRKPNIGGNMAQLDKIFPTNDCSMCVMAPKLVEVGRNRNIELLMNTEVMHVRGAVGHFTVTLRTRPRRVDPDKCTACGACAAACPLEVGNVYNEGLSSRSAAFVNFPQAIPSAYMIDRQMAPCVYACPIHLNVRDYVGRIAEGRFDEALALIREQLPFPGIIGRICSHPCEDQCLRGKAVDQPIAICALKRFVADHESQAGDVPLPPQEVDRGREVAIIGGGPAGVTCALELRKRGYGVTLFDAYDRLGGMLYVGVPRYRLPGDVLDREFSIIERMGVKVRYNTRIGRDLGLHHVFSSFDAVFIASGAHGRRRLGIANEDAEGVLNALDFLRSVNRGESLRVGERVLVLGGGNVAMDAALTARRLGGREVHIVALESWDDMPAHRWEIEQAVEEGMSIHNGWGPARIDVLDGHLKGVQFQRCSRVYDADGLFDPLYDGSSTLFMDADTVILVIYETIDTAYLAESGEVELLGDGRVRVDPVSLQTSVPGVFAGGNVVTGPKTAIHAVAQGKTAAESVRRFLEGEDLREGRLAQDDKVLDEPPFMPEKRPRVFVPRAGLGDRDGFGEINGTMSTEQALGEAARCMSCRRCLGCGLCKEVCRPEAIEYDHGPVETRLVVGSVVVAAGYDEFDAREMKEFGYARYRNVVTSVEYERMLSATGPTGSLVMRPSDGTIPRKIAFLQCVGSRNRTNPYCSSVCCMYSTEEAVISREHHPDIEATIFYNDLRAFGKGHQQHVDRAARDHGIRFVKSLVSRVLEAPASRNLQIAYVDSAGKLRMEEFDLVVLAVGLRPSKQLKGLCGILGVEVNEQGFIRMSGTDPYATSVPGIFVAGACESPKDISETVIDGCGAAHEAQVPIRQRRWLDVKQVPLPPERDVTGEEVRIGVFICNCGVNIGGYVDVPVVREYAATLPGVVVADDNLFSCAQDTQEKIKRLIDEYGLNRVVVASCSTRTHEPLFRSLIREKGLNPYLFEMANIRDQCSWVHMGDKTAATEKAKVLVRMAVANAGLTRPLREALLPVNKGALVVGGGIAGMTAALSLADDGFSVYLVEREGELGGNLKDIFRTVDGTDVQALLREQVNRVKRQANVQVFTGWEVHAFSGSKGNFCTGIRRRSDGEKGVLNHGVVIVATGVEGCDPSGEYGFGGDGRVITQLQLERRLSGDDVALPGAVVMVQCVGSRDEGRPYCSRICCSTAVKNALALKQMSPHTDVVILYRDMVTYGFLEVYYEEARRKGVRFVRFLPQAPPVVEKGEGGLLVHVPDPSAGDALRFRADLVVLSQGVVPRENEVLARILRVPRTPEGFFLEAHMKLRPIDFSHEGIYLAGACHSPRNIYETVAQAKGAAARALTVLARDELMAGAVVAVVDEDRCASCLTCVRICPYSVPVIGGKGRAEIKAEACKGCGTCAAECPARAIELQSFRDDQIVAKTQAAGNGGWRVKSQK